MFVSLYRLYQSFEQGLALSAVADELVRDPEAFRATVRARFAIPEAPKAIEAPEQHLSLAA